MASPVRRARRLWRFWRSEQHTLRQGFVALFISSGGDLLAGLALGSMTHTLTTLPGLLVLVPAAIGMRGNIFGALGSRLGRRGEQVSGTVHVGAVEHPQVRGPEPVVGGRVVDMTNPGHRPAEGRGV